MPLPWASAVMLYGDDRPLFTGEQAVAWAEALAARCGTPLVALARPGRRLKLAQRANAEEILDKYGWLECRAADVGDMPAYAEFALLADRKHNQLIVYADGAKVGDPSTFGRGVADVLGPALAAVHGGFGFQREYRRGPQGYAIGLLVNPAPGDIEDQKNVERWNWARAFGQWQGYLRDVYPVNILGPTLARSLRVDNAALIAWIQHDAARGTVQPGEGGAWIWYVTPMQRQAIREALVAAGLIVSEHAHGTRSQRPAAEQVRDAN